MTQDVRMSEEQSDESEWEYEYDPDELEDHYVILDIPLSVDAPRVGRKQNTDDIFAVHDRSLQKSSSKSKAKSTRGVGRGRGRRKRSRGAKVAAPENELGTETDGSDGVQEAAREDAAQTGPGDSTATGGEAKSAGENTTPSQAIQIIALNSPEPIISYKGHIYSCQWSSSIGSDLLFTRPSIHVDPDLEYEPLKSFAVWDLLGISSATLVATPASLQPRRLELMAPTSSPAAVPAANHSDIQIQDEDVRQQDVFLRRFADIKAWKGEATPHTLAALQAKTTPDGRLAPYPRGRGSRAGESTRRPRRTRAAMNATPRSNSDLQNIAPYPSASSASASAPTPSSWTPLDNPQLPPFPNLDGTVEESPSGPSRAELPPFPSFDGDSDDRTSGPPLAARPLNVVDGHQSDNGKENDPNGSGDEGVGASGNNNES